MWYNGNDFGQCWYVNKVNKAPTWTIDLEQAWTRVPHRQACDSLSHVSGYASARFCLGKLAEGS
jgi:hypothetical protein